MRRQQKKRNKKKVVAKGNNRVEVVPERDDRNESTVQESYLREHDAAIVNNAIRDSGRSVVVGALVLIILYAAGMLVSAGSVEGIGNYLSSLLGF